MMTTLTRSGDLPIRVVFLTFYYEAWDALADIHAIMLADPRFEVTVISIPRRFTGDSGFAEEEDVSAFFDAAGVDHLRFADSDSFVGLERIRAMAPDYVFINYPWQRNYQPGYRVEHLSEFTKVCVVPYYSLALVNEPGEVGVAPHLFEQRSHQLASLVFTQDASVREAYSHTARGNAHVHLTGTPKIDALVREANDGVTRWPMGPSPHLRMVWAPHHSYGSGWLNFGLFVHVYKEMLEFAQGNLDVDIVLRPHPFLFGTLVSREIVSASELDAWFAAWNALPNTAFDEDGDTGHLFAATDIFVTDGISFIAEFPLATGKPTVFMEKTAHWPFSPLGEIAAEANIRVPDMAGFLDVFEQIRRDGLPDRSSGIAELQRVAAPETSRCAGDDGDFLLTHVFLLIDQARFLALWGFLGETDGDFFADLAKGF